MKKSVAAALAAAVIVGTSATTFAAANPFSDVPAGHWAYNSVAKLAAAGVIEGYGDGTYRGDRNITRYEMAQMIAKAMAKNPTGVTKAELDRLAAEFRDELDALGVRVAELEKYSDKVIWHGKLEYTYHQFKEDPFNTGKKTKTTENGYVFRFEPEAEVNDHWTLHARIDAEGDLKDDATTDFTLKRAWAQGDYDNFQVKLGRFELYPEGESGLIWDTEISGAELTFGSKWKFTATGGRISSDLVQGGWNGIQPVDISDDYDDIADPATVVGLRVDYNQGTKGFFGGAGWYNIKDDDLAWSRRQFFNRLNNEGIGIDDTGALKKAMAHYNKTNIWTANLGYKFNDLLTLKGVYARNTKADWEKDSWQVELNYGNYEDASEKGQWSVWTGYRKFGTNATLAGTDDEDTMLGTRGWVVGAAWAPLRNVGVIARYFNGKYISDGAFNSGHGKAQKLFGRVEFFF